MNTEQFITKIREKIIAGTSFTKVYSSELPSGESNVCAVGIVAGLTNNDLTNYGYSTITFRVLIRGNESDLDTRGLCDEVFDTLHLLQNIDLTDGRIINITGSTPVFVRKDENQRYIYNITFDCNVR